MTREIKFRAWDGNRMLYRGLFDRNWYATPFNDEQGCHCVGGIHPDDQHNMKVMEFTSLQDATGREIYEGDILDEKYKWEVVFIDGAFWAKSYRTVINIAELQKKRQMAGIPIEVIGNIYESPELLK